MALVHCGCVGDRGVMRLTTKPGAHPAAELRHLRWRYVRIDPVEGLCKEDEIEDLPAASQSSKVATSTGMAWSETTRHPRVGFHSKNNRAGLLQLRRCDPQSLLPRRAHCRKP
jgi:hypothetical protein